MTVRTDISPEEMYNLAIKSMLNPEDAKKLVRGEIKDSFILKIAIDLQSKNGIVLVLISEIAKKVLDIYSIIGTANNLKKIKTFENVEQIFEDLTKLMEFGGIEKALSERIGRCIYRAMGPNTIDSILVNLKKKATSEIASVIEEAVISETKLKNTQVFIEVEKISSLDFYKYNTLKNIHPEVRNPFEEVSQSQTQTKIEVPIVKLSKTSVEQAIDDIITSYDKIIKCNVGISPTKGLEFSKLKPNQPIYFHLPQFTPDEKNVARSMGAINKNGKPIPIVGKFVKIIAGQNNEYHIFAKGPGGVLLHSTETQQVKVAYPIEEEILDSNSKQILIIILAAFSLLIGALLYLLFH
jgi:hypothetical protein